MRIRRRIPERLRRRDGGPQHSALQRRADLRSMLRAEMRQRRHVERLLPKRAHNPNHRHKPLPAALVTDTLHRRLVRPAGDALRPDHAHVREDGPRRRRRRPRQLPPGPVRETGRREVRDHREPELEPGAGLQRWRGRRREEREGKRVKYGLDSDAEELGAEVGHQGG
ncbi:unnamed protein product [Linum tenue]|uniref:Uncharacterized protein n=1 Tax=Linum tenue TaxID=586396 RepID=A0AAV0N4B7_9ROSI|nr:unnamed protein product [Linum tenue]